MVYGQVDPNEIISLAKSEKPVPAPEGFGQVEGDGTKPTGLENDKKILETVLSFMIGILYRPFLMQHEAK